MKKQLYIRLISLVVLLSATLPVSANRIITKTEVYEFYDEPYDWDGVGFYSQDPLTEEENTNWRGNNFEYYGDKTLKGEGNSTENIYLETITSLPGRVTKVTIEAKAWTTKGWVWMNVNNGDDEEIQTTDQYDMDAISYEDYVFNNPTDNGGYLKISFSLSTYARIYIRSITVEYEYEVPNEPYALLSNDNKTLTFYYDDQKDLNDYLSVGPFDDPEDQSWKDHKESITTVNFDNSFANYTALSSTRYWFHNCENLTIFNNLSNLKTSQVTDMVGMFGGCSSLTALDLSSFDTGNVLDMRRMFNSCSNLTNLDVSSFNTSKVTKMGGMFNDCPVLVNLDITNFNTSKVTDMSLMFSGCSSLVSLDLSNFNTAAVTTMTHMFYGCTNLTTITVACEWNTDAVTESSDMFLDCTSIKGRKGTTYDASHVDKSYAHNDEGASNPGYLTDKLEVYAIEESESGKYVLTFYYDNKKKTRDYPKSIGPFSSFNAVSWYSHAYWFNTVRFDSSMAECTNITSTAYWFYGFTELTTIEGLEYLNTSNVTDMAGMFGHCYQMTNIDVSHFDTSNVTDMSAMFNMCTYLTSIDVSHFNTSNVTNMESMFNDCKKLTILDLSSFNTANVTTMSRMFEGCQELKRLDLSSFNTNNVTNPWSMFSGCSSLTRIYVSDQWKASSLGYTSGMFSNCTSLVGGAGTVYDSNHTDGSYAHIDGGTDNPGYLTERGIEPYAVLSSDNKTLTFKYDMEWGANALSIGPFDGYSDRGWYDHREDITKVVFDDSFSQYTGLTSTFLWFDQSSNIATIEGLSNLNTENVVNMRSMFEECSSLTTLDLSNFNTAKVTDFGNMFAGCSNLATIYVGEGWSTEAVTEESTYMFGGCTSLVGGAGTTYDENHTDIEYAHIDDTSNLGYLTDANLRESYAVLTDNDDNVTTDEGTVKGKTLTFYYDTQKESRGGMSVGPFSYSDARSWHNASESITKVVFDASFVNCTSLSSTALWFSGCKNLTDITGIENLNTANVWNMNEMFAGCSSLSSLDVSNFNTANVTDMGGMFFRCSGLTTLDVSNFNTTEVTNMHGMFMDCSGLTNLDVSHFNTANVTSMYGMFIECSGLTSLDLSNFNTANVTDMAAMFEGCSGLTSLDVSKFKTAEVTKMTYMFEGCSSLKNLDVSNFNTTNVTIMSGMFYECSSLTSLDVSNFNTSKVTSMSWMFTSCSGITSLDLSNFNTAKVTDMSFMVYGCSGLTNLDVSNFNTANVTNMRAMFAYSSGLTSLDLSNFNTANVTIMSCMFENCSGLTSLDVSNFNTANVTNMAFMFARCSGLTSLDVSNFNTTNVTIMSGMFYECSSLTSLDLGNFNTSKVIYDANDYTSGIQGMFSGCSALTTIYVGEGWNIDNLTESSDVFTDCTALVGGAGTTYDANHTDETYARIDGGPTSSTPGYFTDINSIPLEPYAVLTDNDDDVTTDEGTLKQKTLTFYYDSHKESRGGMSVGPFALDSDMAWFNQTKSITTVVFDNSFANCTTLTSTAHWFERCSNISSILGIDNLKTDKVTNMASMFGYCSSLTSLDLSGFNTTNVTDMSCMFGNCSGLTSLNISSFNTENVTDMISMFVGCSGLTNLDVTNFKTDNVTDMNGMFGYCSSLKSLDLSGFNTESVTGMQAMFSGCSNLGTIYVGDKWNVSSVTYRCFVFEDCTALVGGAGTPYDPNHTDTEYARIDGGPDSDTPGYFTEKGPEAYAVLTDNDDEVTTEDGTTTKGKTLTFYYDRKKADNNGLSVGPFSGFDESPWINDCQRITSVVFDDLFANCTSITSTAYWFAGCKNLTNIKGIENLNTANVTDMNWMFGGCSSLTSLDVSNFNTSKVKDMHYMFVSCSGLTRLDVSNFNTENVTIMGSMFSGCSGLTSLDVSNFNTENVTYMADMFDGCSGLTHLDLSNFNTANVTEMTAMFYGCSGLTNLDLSNFNTENVTIMWCMFEGCSGLTSLDVSNFNTANVTDMGYMFDGCSRLTSVDVSNFNTTNVTNMGSMFLNCSGLTSLDVSNFNTANVTVMDNMFHNCSGLTSLDLSNFNTANVIYMNTMFYNCSGLKSLDVSNFNTTNVTGMNWMFGNCSSLTSLDVSNFNTANVVDMIGMFGYCSGLKSLDVSNFNTTNVIYMYSVFYDCSGLTSLDVSSFNTANVKVMGAMFSGCSSLTSLNLSNFNTENVTDMSEMFSGCSGITSLDLSNFNTSKVIYDADNYQYGIQNMFSGCSALTTIYVGAGWNIDNLTESADVFTGCTALVGGAGTLYDANHTDYTYARIDDPDNDKPGYFTSIGILGDVNGDGVVNIADARAMVSYILGTYEANFGVKQADMNGDGAIDIFDVTLVVNIVLEDDTNNPSGSRAMTRGDISQAEIIRVKAEGNGISLAINEAERYTAFQFDLKLPEGVKLTSVKLASDIPDYLLRFAEHQGNRYRVIGLSLSNEVLSTADGQLIKLLVSDSVDETDVSIDNVLFVTPGNKVTTHIGAIEYNYQADGETIYNLNGQKLNVKRQQLRKGVYIINHKKVIIK